MSLAHSELILSEEGRIYHLDLLPNEISDTIILVGDQDRVPLISKYFDKIEVYRQKREFTCHTGVYKGKRISVISTGIGTDNVDIVLNELDALANIDFKSRTEKPQKTRLKFIRIGTCGVLQGDIPLGSYILTSGAIGMDNLAHFYQIDYSNDEKELLNAFKNQIQFPNKLNPYYINAAENQNALLRNNPKITEGITVTATGFYGPQGRQLRIPLQKNHFVENLAQFSFNEKKILNLEMETSGVLALSKAMNHEATTICLALANRAKGEFLNNYSEQMDKLIEFVLERIVVTR